jgi:plastocyanin
MEKLTLLSKFWKRHLSSFAVLLAISTSLFLPSMTLAAKKLSDPSPQTYTVMVGLEQSKLGIAVNAYFPQTVTIHAGDTVHWVQNTNEIHTVTILGGIFPPDLLSPSAEVPGADPTISPLAFTPFVVEQSPSSGSEFSGGLGGHANSGIMGREPGQVEEYDLTFTTEGTFGYYCIVHGFIMSGEVVVVSDDVRIPSPKQVTAQARREMAEALSLVPGVVMNASEQVVPPEMNDDDTVTHTIMLGYSEIVTASYADLEIDLLQFFPKRLTVRPGDIVDFVMSEYNTAPHTATFLNGAEEPPLTEFKNGFLYLNSEVVFPSGDDVLTRSGIFSSGLMLPVPPGTTYSLEVGNMKPGLQQFLCLLHDGSGMKGELMVVPGRNR